jgi:hypothetical protein
VADIAPKRKLGNYPSRYPHRDTKGKTITDEIRFKWDGFSYALGIKMDMDGMSRQRIFYGVLWILMFVLLAIVLFLILNPFLWQIGRD